MPEPVQQVVLATRNVGKLAELRRILDAHLVRADGSRLPVELLGVDAFPDAPEVEETGETFAANALLKAHALATHTGLVAVADDSGLCVDALGGAPGVLSARWAGAHGDDAANLDLVLTQLADVHGDERAAHFTCAAAVVAPGRGEACVEGHVHGRLVREPRGTNGFGYDPVFVPDGHDLTTAEMASHDKDAISHRGQALRALVPVLAELLTRAPGQEARPPAP